MKTLKLLNLALALCFSLSIAAASNLSDDLDRNTTPGFLEERENEFINSRDEADANLVPGPLEERQKEEEMESDVLQKDDPRKAYDPLDSEIDE